MSIPSRLYTLNDCTAFWCYVHKQDLRFDKAVSRMYSGLGLQNDLNGILGVGFSNVTNFIDSLSECKLVSSLSYLFSSYLPFQV